MTSQFKENFQIGDKLIGSDAPVLIIAEAGVAHFGDMDLARQLVDLAANAGADVFKTQFFDVEEMFAESASEWRDRLRPRNLTLEQAHELRERCQDRGLLFAATAHDESRIPWLAELDVPFVKVGSGERGNPAFLQKLASLNVPMIVSTGMYNEQDVVDALDACQSGGCDRLALLHCITSYPTPADQVNLRAMDRLAELFSGPVGYSDHTEDGLAVLAAVARGARVIEKHITILRDIPNAQDWKVSADEATFPALVSDIRRVEALLGEGGKFIANCEVPGTEWALKSLVAVRALPVGHVLTTDDLIAKRPGDGISPSRAQEFFGRTLLRPLGRDELIRESDVDD